MAKNPNPSLLDPGQIIKRVYDEANDQIRTTIDASINVAGQQTLVITDTVDSIVAFGTTDGTFTGTHKAIKVDTNGVVQVSATIPGTITVNQGTSPWVVSGTVTANAGSGTFSTSIQGLPTFQTSQYTVGVSAVQLAVTPLTNRSSVSIKVKTTADSEIVYIGNSSSVTTSTGYALFNRDSVSIDLTGAQTLYAISSLAGQTVYVVEAG